MIMLIARFLGALSAYGRTGQIAFAIATGVTLAIVPGGTLIWVIILLPMMMVRINQAALLGTMGLVRLTAPLIDPFTESIGFRILSIQALHEPMGRFLSMPMAAWLRFDDSFVFGGVVVGIVGWPIYFCMALFIVTGYRRFLAVRIKAVFGKIGAKVPWLRKLGRGISASRSLGASL